MHDQGLPARSSKTPHSLHYRLDHTPMPRTFGSMRVKRAYVEEDVHLHKQDANPTGAGREVPYLQFRELSRCGQLVHGVFTRQGGVSESPYDTLNSSYQTGDGQERVRRNLQIIREAVGAQHLVFMNQMHGKEMLVLRQGSFQALQAPPDADAIITDIPNLAIMVKQADCQAVILFDPTKGVVSNVHCGWRGNVSNILGSAVERMGSDFGCRPQDLRAAIGPSLGRCCAEFDSHKEFFPKHFRPFMVREGYFDLPNISLWQLLEAGLKRDHIEVVRICTSCNTNVFYSYRSEGTTGRFATVAMLKG